MVIWLHCHCKNRLLPFDTGIPLNKTKKKTLKKIMTWESISQKFCFSFHGKVKELCVIIWKTKATRKSVMQLFWLKQNQHVNFFSRKVDIDFRERNKKVIKTLFYLSHNRKKGTWIGWKKTSFGAFLNVHLLWSYLNEHVFVFHFRSLYILQFFKDV